MKCTMTVLGTGRMAGALGQRLLACGFKVVFGSRAPASQKVTELLAKLGNEASVTSIDNAVSQAETIILATPYAAMQDILSVTGDLAGKTVIDVSNALKMGGDGLMEMASDSSAGEELAAALPEAKVVKAFNTVGFHIFSSPDLATSPVSTMVASDDEFAKQQVIKLAHGLGFETVDVGPMRQSRFLEGMSALYLVPYLQGRVIDAFEYYFRQGTSPAESAGVRAAE